MKNPGGLIFDLNGTMIDDMKFHTKAWFQILNDDLGKRLSWNEVKSQMYGKNSEVLERVFGHGHFSKEEVERISRDKEERYQLGFFPHLSLLPGLSDFLERAKDLHIPMAIGTAAIPFNIDFVLDNLNLRNFFKAIVSADDVKHSKPDPETFCTAADLLNVSSASCIVFEDAPKGVEAALRANMPCVVLTTMHEKHEFQSYSNIIAYIKDFTDPFCKHLLQPEPALS